ncbi:MAG: hypothetical protein HRU38_20785 [Saccharospirillaceae bacterium]|nr:hypothetical protein [Saccharospirillaceae bacterium]
MLTKITLTLMVLLMSAHSLAFEPIGVKRTLPLYLSIDRTFHSSSPSYSETSFIVLDNYGYTSTGLKVGFHVHPLLDIRATFRISNIELPIHEWAYFNDNMKGIPSPTYAFSVPQDKLQLGVFIPFMGVKDGGYKGYNKHVGLEIGANYSLPDQLIGQSDETDLSFTGNGFYVDVSSVNSPFNSDRLIITYSAGFERNFYSINGTVLNDTQYQGNVAITSFHFAIALLSQI